MIVAAVAHHRMVNHSQHETAEEGEKMKVPEPRKLPSGTWFIQMRLNGISVPVSASTKKECIRQAQLIKAEHRAGKRHFVLTDKTVKDVLDEYIEKKRGGLSPSTIRGMKK